MKKNRIVSAVIVAAAATTGALLAAPPRPPKPDCRIVLCAYPDCGPNQHAVIPKGKCCPVCVPN